MALDIHIIPLAFTSPVSGSYTGFGFDVEFEELFAIVDLTTSAFPQLLRMRDYWEDTVYSGDDLTSLIDEIQTIRGSVERPSLLDTTLARLLECCLTASQQNKAVLLFAD